jgi:Na+-transporting methylmalonyl-CoA/oxaloacetate decarboxylase gamma subunit
MKRKFLLLLGLLLMGYCGVSAQARKALKINEVMVVNDDNAVDEFGRHSAWIELYNTNHAPMEISSVYLTNDTTQPRLYPVPLGDVKTKMPKRSCVLFWADGRSTDGTFHTSFTLDPTKPNTIAIYDADGITMIDCVTVPVLQPGQSYARTEDGFGEWAIRNGSTADGDYITPGSRNQIQGTNPKIEEFKEKDANGFAMTLTAMGIVFSALLILSICFYIISRINALRSQRKKMEAQGLDHKSIHPDEHPEGDSGEEIAAIVMALHDHLDAHDRESSVLTINKVRKAYSPWSSHIYTLRQMPNRR